jgi:hypothetical protein
MALLIVRPAAGVDGEGVNSCFLYNKTARSYQEPPAPENQANYDI